MIVVTRLSGGQFGVNPDLIQRVDSAPDTILTLIDGAKYIVAESMEDVIERINEHRARLLARSRELTGAPVLELVPDRADDEPAAGPHGGPHPLRPAVDDDPHEHLAPAVPLRPRGR